MPSRNKNRNTNKSNNNTNKRKRKKPTHPPWKAMILEAFQHYKRPLTKGDIKKFVKGKYDDLKKATTNQLNTNLKRALSKGVKNGIINEDEIAHKLVRYSINWDKVNDQKLGKSKRARQLNSRRPPSLQIGSRRLENANEFRFLCFAFCFMFMLLCVHAVRF